MVIDLRLPDEAGLNVLKRVKTIKPSIKSVVIAAFPSAGLMVEAMKLGAVDYPVKPIAPDDLETLLQQALLECQSHE